MGDPAELSAGRRRALTVAVLASYLLIALLVTGGMLLHPSHELAINDSDSALLSWFLQHDAHALAHGGKGLFVTHDLNAPAGVNLMWNTALLLPGILLAPLTWATDGRTTYAVLLWLAPALSAFSMYLCLAAQLRGRPFVRGRLPRYLGGLLFGFSPALIAQSIGHLQMTLLPLVPVILLVVVEAAVGTRNAVRVGVTAGFVGAAQLLTGEEALFFTAFTSVLVLIALAACRPRDITAERVRRFATVTCVALGCFLAVASVPLLIQLFGPQHVHGTPFTRDYFKLDTTAFTTPTSLQLLSSSKAQQLSSAYRGGPEEHTGYLGWPLLLLAFVMLLVRWRDLRVRIPVLITWVLSVLALGLHPIVHLVPHDDVTLPWGLLIDAPLFESTIISRLPLITALLLAVVLAAALEWTWTTSRVLAPVLGVVVLLPLIPAHIDTAPRPVVPEFFRAGAKQIPAGSTVIVAPPAGYGHVDAMRWQAAADFRFRLVGGYFIGPSYDGRALIGPLPRTLPTLLDQVRDKGAVQVTDEQRAAVAQDLAYYQASTIVVGPMPHEAEAVALVSDLLGRAPEQVGGVNLWRL